MTDKKLAEKQANEAIYECGIYKGRKAEQERILEWIDRNRYAIEQLPENKYNSGRMQTLERIEYFVREGGIGTVGSDKEIEKLIKGAMK